MRKWFVEEYCEYGYEGNELVAISKDRIHERLHGGVGKHCRPIVEYNSRYIGEGARIVMTRNEKPEAHGWHPYE